MNSLTLFVKSGCPWCQRVLDFAAANNIRFAVIKEKHEAGVLDELLRRGGKSQFPYLVDTTSGIEMYESGDIVAYLAGLLDQGVPVIPAQSEESIPKVCSIDLV